MSELVVLVPVLGRPQNVVPLLKSIDAATPGARVVFIHDAGDELEERAINDALTENAVEAFWSEGRFGSLRVNGVCFTGNYAAKINEGIRLSSEPLIFLGADDLDFHPGWLEAALAKTTDGIGVVGTNDLCNPRTATGELATHSLVSREYVARGTIDEPDRLLHEGYRHEWVDQEFTETAKSRNAFAHAPDSIVEHLHPDVGKAPMDDLYAGRPPRMRQGRRLYQRRRHLWA